MRAPILVAGMLCLALAACGTAGPANGPGSAGSTGPGPVAAIPSGSDGLSWARLGQGQRLALRQGCRAMHGRNFTRYNQCVAGSTESVRALAQGCAQRYAGNAEMIRTCRET